MDRNEIRKFAGKTGFLTIRRVLAVLGVGISVGFIGLQLQQIRNVEAFSNALLEDSRSNSLQESLIQRIRTIYEPEFFAEVNQWARFRGLIDGVNNDEPQTAINFITRTYESQSIRRSDFDLRGLHVFKPDYTLIGSAESGEKLSGITSNPDIRGFLMARGKRERKQPFGFAWQAEDGTPMHSIVLPIGGFRVFGYIEAVSMPLVNFKGVAEAMGGDIRVFDKDGNVIYTFLTEPVSADAEPGLPDNVIARSFPVAVTTANGAPWMDITFTWDAGKFEANMAKETQNSLLLTGMMLVVVWVAGYGLLHVAVFVNTRRFADSMAQLAGGDADVTVPRTGPDEFMEMAGALSILKDNVHEVFELKNMTEESTTPTGLLDRQGKLIFINKAARDFLAQWSISSDDPADILGLGADFVAECIDPARLPIHRREVSVKARDLVLSVEPVNNVHGQLSSSMVNWYDATDARVQQRFAAKVMEDVRQVAQTVSSQSEQLQRLAADLTSQSSATISRAGEASDIVSGNRSNAEDVASATHDLSGGMQGINTSSSTALRNASLVMDQLTAADALADDLNVQAGEIVGVVEMINQIADQTRMLALNANIEAQRAGNAGLGFAVVAAEVKDLASETADATHQISTSVEGIQAGLKATLDSFASIRDAMSEVSDVQNNIAGEVDRQTATSGDIAERVGKIADGTRMVQELIDTVSGQARTTGDIASQLKEASDNLSTQAGQLNARLDEYRG